MSTHRNVIVIGGGPAGYTAGLYTARAELAPLVFEGSQYGGALMNTTEVENYPGFADGIMGPDLMSNIRSQAERFGAELVADDVTEVDLGGPIKTVQTLGGTFTADAVILAMGSAHRTLGVPDEAELSGHGVSYCATCDGFFFRSKDIIVVGGGDTAMEEAIFLTKFAHTVTVVHRRHELRASRVMVERAQANPKIRWQLGYEVDSLISGDKGHGSLSGVRLRPTGAAPGSGQIEHAAQGLFVAIGHDPRSQLVRGQVSINPDGTVRVDGISSRASTMGVFACGDLVDSTYRQAITAAASGCRAAIDVERYLVGRRDLLTERLAS